MTTLYGIGTCETVRKARKWLASHHIAYDYRDLRDDVLPPEKVRSWVDRCGGKTLLNRRSTTWKNLDSREQAEADQGKVVELLLKYPTLIKRPVLEKGGKLHLGFNELAYAVIFES